MVFEMAGGLVGKRNLTPTRKASLPHLRYMRNINLEH